MLKELQSLEDNLKNLDILDLKDINLKKTHLFIVDLNNGFAKSGNLYSDRVNALIKPTVEFLKLIQNDILKITAFTDCHDENSLEFIGEFMHFSPTLMFILSALAIVPLAGLMGEATEEISFYTGPKLGGFLNATFGNATELIISFFALKDTSFDGIDNILIIGDCTDICIYQFAVTLRAYFNEKNIKKEIIVPINLIDTYDIPKIHNAKIFNTVFINSMIQNGIKVVSSIKNG